MLESIIAGYVLICAIGFGVRYRGNKREGWTRFAIVTALPVIGFLMPIFWPKRWHDRNESKPKVTEFDLFDHKAHEDSRHAGIYNRPEAVKEMNVVPLEEALLVNDLSTRRRVMIDLLKQDSLEYLEVLQLAVANEDTETSHYAVSAIVEVKRKLTLALQELSVQYEQNREDAHLLRSYADVLKGYMRSGFLDERTLFHHKHTYSAVLGRLLEVVPDSAEFYKEKIETDLELGEYAAAERTARQFLRQFPRREEAYLCMMNVYYSSRAIDKLMNTLDQLKRSPVRLSSEALTLVRFWSEGKGNEQESQT